MPCVVVVEALTTVGWGVPNGCGEISVPRECVFRSQLSVSQTANGVS